MEIFADFSKRAVVHSDALDWIDSPMPGVERKPLDRVGNEVARATTIVRYAKGSKFSPHIHIGGEEFVVLEGVFQDEHGDFPAGSYIRNPPQSKHTPGSDDGCVIFVKLWQFQPDDRTHVRLQINKMSAIESSSPGVSITPLYKDAYEEVNIFYFEPNATIDIPVDDGAELLVLSGTIEEKKDTLEKYSWLRLPQGDKFIAKAGSEGAKIWIKLGNQSNIENQITRVKAASRNSRK